MHGPDLDDAVYHDCLADCCQINWLKPSKKGEQQPALSNDTLFPLEAFMDSRIPGFSPEEQSEVREVTRRMLAIFVHPFS
jgi:hypothetical protein